MDLEYFDTKIGGTHYHAHLKLREKLVQSRRWLSLGTKIMDIIDTKLTPSGVSRPQGYRSGLEYYTPKIYIINYLIPVFLVLPV